MFGLFVCFRGSPKKTQIQLRESCGWFFVPAGVTKKLQARGIGTNVAAFQKREIDR